MDLDFGRIDGDLEEIISEYDERIGGMEGKDGGGTRGDKGKLVEDLTKPLLS